MRQVTLGKTNVPVSAISLGTWAFGGANMAGKIPVGWSGQKDKDSQQVLLKAWELNINHWSTIVVYKNNKKITSSVGLVDKDQIYSLIKKGI